MEENNYNELSGEEASRDETRDVTDGAVRSSNEAAEEEDVSGASLAVVPKERRARSDVSKNAESICRALGMVTRVQLE